MYSFDMKNIVPKDSLTCLVAKATLDESLLWHKRLDHINFKNINKLIKDNLVRDNLGKFDGKSDDGFFVGYSLRTKKVEENLHIRMLVMMNQILLLMIIRMMTKICLKMITVLNTASSSDPHSPIDMFKLGASDTLEATHVEFFSNRDAPEVDLGNIPNSYRVPTTSHTRIHKDHPITNVIGEVKSSLQTRRMIKPTSEKGFLSAVYEEKTHDTLNTCLYACFLSQIEPISIAKALSDSSWVEAMHEELL
nr:hypothetical protein [Tanacetum cinerariifolium]